MGRDMRRLEQAFGSRLKKGLALRDFTTLGIGGPARAMVVAHTREELIDAVRMAREEGTPLLLLGGGSNLLVADAGVDSLVIKNEVAGIERTGEDVVVQSGSLLQDLVDFSVANGLAGLQRMTGIPGTVGGAVFGNAGAYGQTISDHLEEVVCFDGRRLVSFAKDECQFAYRHSAFKTNGCVVLAARLRLPKEDAEALAADARAVLTQRLAKYPPGLRCPGSFFKNVLAETLPAASLELIPPERVIHGKVPAGFLLETVGAKGQRLGDIEVAAASANLFVNRGNGTAADVVALAARLAGKVKEKYGIELVPEVQLVNLPPLRL